MNSEAKASKFLENLEEMFHLLLYLSMNKGNDNGPIKHYFMISGGPF